MSTNSALPSTFAETAIPLDYPQSQTEVDLNVVLLQLRGYLQEIWEQTWNIFTGHDLDEHEFVDLHRNLTEVDDSLNPEKPGETLTGMVARSYFAFLKFDFSLRGLLKPYSDGSPGETHLLSDALAEVEIEDAMLEPLKCVMEKVQEAYTTVEEVFKNRTLLDHEWWKETYGTFAVEMSDKPPETMANKGPLAYSSLDTNVMRQAFCEWTLQQVRPEVTVQWTTVSTAGQSHQETRSIKSILPAVTWAEETIFDASEMQILVKSYIESDLFTVMGYTEGPEAVR